WDQWPAPPTTLDAAASNPCPDEGLERGINQTPPAPTALLAQGVTRHPFLARPGHHPPPVVASLDGQGPTLRTPSPDRRSHRRTRH
ncbi:IS701 family transposase, partial [Streptomyces asiaticus]